MQSKVTKSSRRSLLLACAAAMVAVGATQPAQAEYPEKPVELTILFGGTAQSIGQLLAELMSKELPQPVVAVSRPGGSGAVGYNHVHGAGNDGYNIVWNSNSITTASQQGNMDLTYKDFVPIARVSVEAPVLAVRSDTGWKTLEDMAKAAKAEGKKLKIGISGKGSFTHVTSAALFDALGLDVIYVPYGRGKAPAELLGGRIDAALQWPGQFAQYAKDGKLNLLAVTSDKRVPLIPDVPTAEEEGVDVNMSMWRGLAAPAGTQPEVIKTLQEAAKKATETPQFKKAAENLGFQIEFLPADQFGKLIEEDDTRIRQVMKGLGLGKN